ncbi:unnamed protein product, partial [marine sediment metagenome]
SGEDKFIFLSKSLFLITPSRFEAMPRVPLEAQACGIPVIATKIPSFEFVIKDSFTGILIPKDSPERLVENIRDLIENAEK